MSDLMAGDEMTGVSLAGTQLRANLYARQLYDNRWNDIEVIIHYKCINNINTGGFKLSISKKLNIDNMKGTRIRAITFARRYMA